MSATRLDLIFQAQNKVFVNVSVVFREDSNTERYVTGRRHVPNPEEKYRPINHASAAVIHTHPSSSELE